MWYKYFSATGKYLDNDELINIFNESADEKCKRIDENKKAFESKAKQKTEYAISATTL